MRFDPSGMDAAFERMRKAARDKGKDLADSQGKAFLQTTKREAWKAAPTKDLLVSTAQRLGWRLKRQKGVSVAKELARRIRARGTFSRGWKITGISSAATKIRIWIGNAVTYAGAADAKSHSAEKAANIVGGKFKDKLTRLAKAATSMFT